mgnify:CR=1 FL=1
MKRIVRVCNTAMIEEKNASVESNLERAKSLLEAAGRQGVDVVCLPELFSLIGLQIQGESMADQKEAIENAFDLWRGSHEQIDDVCVFGVKP